MGVAMVDGYEGGNAWSVAHGVFYSLKGGGDARKRAIVALWARAVAVGLLLLQGR